MDKFLLASVFTAMASVASAGEITCDVIMEGEKFTSVKTLNFPAPGELVRLSSPPTVIHVGNGKSVTVTNENGFVVCRVEEKQ